MWSTHHKAHSRRTAGVTRGMALASRSHGQEHNSDILWRGVDKQGVDSNGSALRDISKCFNFVGGAWRI